MTLIEKIKNWYASKREIMDDERIIRRYDKIQARVYVLSQLACGHSISFWEHLDMCTFPWKYSRASKIDDRSPPQEAYDATMKRKIARIIPKLKKDLKETA